MTLLERDILAVLLSLNTVFIILALVSPITYDLGQSPIYLTTLAWGLPLGALGVWWNHWTSRRSEVGV